MEYNPASQIMVPVKNPSEVPDINHKIYKAISILLIVAGCITAVYQYWYNRSLWYDEGFIALNILDRDFIELLKPLSYGQVAPILYLELTKLFTIIFSSSEYGLRLISIISFIFSIILFYKVMCRLLENQLAVIIGLAIFIFNATLIYYSSEVKQYMTDVFVTLLLLHLVTKEYKNDKQKYWSVLVAGIVGMFLSNISVIILPMIFSFLVFDYRTKTRKIANRFIIIISSSWAVAFSFYYFAFINGHPSKGLMVEFWENKNAFPPYNILSLEFVVFLKNMFVSIYKDIGVGHKTLKPYKLEWLSLAVFVGSIIFFVIRVVKGRLRLLFLILPIIVHLMLSYLRLYPITGRLILYQYPLIILILVLGVDWAISAIPFKKRILEICIYSIIAFGGITFIKNILPIQREEIKKVISYVEKKIQHDEQIYVYYGGTYILEYYKKIGFFQLNNNIVYGKASRRKPSRYLDEITALKGKYWIVFYHLHKNEGEYILEGLDKSGYKFSDSFETIGASAYLFAF